jgi:putative DNA primase/helicase
VITERLLAVSGEDAITVDRKNLQPLTQKLPTRFMILSNELPRLSDASGALAHRFLILSLERSHLGREDTGLLDRLTPELPGILLWAIEGWRRLTARGHFVQPEAGREAVQDMLDLSSPVGAFVREWCQTGPGLMVPVPDLYEAFGLWAREQGTARVPEKNVFARDLAAAVPGLVRCQPRDGDTRYRGYKGIDLTLGARQTLQVARSRQGGNDDPP